MKALFFTIFILLSFNESITAQQISLFDNNGEARAYIDFDEEATIFFWDGTPVAFLEQDGGEICVIGFNGNFMGWYEDGIIYDKKGYPVGGREGATNMMTKMERMKGMQNNAYNFIFFLKTDNINPIPTTTSTIFQISLPRAILKNG